MQTFPPANLPAFGSRLRQMRRALGVKQSALSGELGLDQSSVSRWEAGYQTPDGDMQHRALALLAGRKKDDFALRRLVETSSLSIHLIEDATHTCLAFSNKRAADWGDADYCALIDTSLWRYATQEIQSAENALVQSDWWSVHQPGPRSFQTSAKTYDDLSVRAGKIVWERLYLSDGTPVRLCTALH